MFLRHIELSLCWCIELLTTRRYVVETEIRCHSLRAFFNLHTIITLANNYCIQKNSILPFGYCICPVYVYDLREVFHFSTVYTAFSDYGHSIGLVFASCGTFAYGSLTAECWSWLVKFVLMVSSVCLILFITLLSDRFLLGIPAKISYGGGRSRYSASSSLSSSSIGGGLPAFESGASLLDESSLERCGGIIVSPVLLTRCVIMEGTRKNEEEKKRVNLFRFKCL